LIRTLLIRPFYSIRTAYMLIKTSAQREFVHLPLSRET
jgi:hypothetical protein